MAFIKLAEVHHGAQHLQVSNQRIHFGDIAVVTIIVATLCLANQVSSGTIDIKLICNVVAQTLDISIILGLGFRLRHPNHFQRPHAIRHILIL